MHAPYCTIAKRILCFGLIGSKRKLRDHQNETTGSLTSEPAETNMLDNCDVIVFNTLLKDKLLIEHNSNSRILTRAMKTPRLKRVHLPHDQQLALYRHHVKHSTLPLTDLGQWAYAQFAHTKAPAPSSVNE